MILLTGGSGQLGTALQKHRLYYAPAHFEFDIVNPKQPEGISAIVHAAADTRVSAIQSDLSQLLNATTVNVTGTIRMVQMANRLDVPIYHISTETCLHPYNAYALTKLLAEEAVKHAKKYTIIRTSFRETPFEYSQAPTDMYTIGDYVSVIAKLINKRIGQPPSNSIEYIGTGAKTMFNLAKQSRPDVIPTTIEEMNKKISFQVQSMQDLQEVKCWQS